MIELPKVMTKRLRRLNDGFWNVARRNFVALIESSKVLEIGAGTGLIFRFYPRECIGTTSEILIKMLEFAKKKIDSKKIDLVQANAENLPFATLVFRSIPNPNKAFSELQTLVEQGDKFILFERVRPKGLFGIQISFEFWNN